MRWAGHIDRTGDINAYKMMVVSLEKKRPVGRPRFLWEDNIRMDLREVGLEGRDWFCPGQDRDLRRAIVILWIPLKS